MITQKLRSLTLVALLSAGLAACGGDDNPHKRPTYDGVPFRVKAKSIHKKVSLADFSIVIKDAQRSPTGAYMAADHAAKRYCIENYGNSEFDWTNVTRTEEGGYQVDYDGGNATFLGSCHT